MELLKYKDYLVKWIIEKVNEAGLNGVVVGLSGGVDSSVVAALAKEAFPEDSLGLFMPINDMGNDLKDAKEVAQKINLKTKMVDLTETFSSISKVINVTEKLPLMNTKPRLRMAALYSIAQEKKYLVLGTDNAAEWMLGYFTKYGDGGVDLLPIVHLTKGEVKEMAKLINLPENTYLKKPTAALWDGQTDEDELGFSYNEVDKFLRGEKISSEIKTKIEHQIKITNHKRKSLPMPKARIKEYIY